jgi:FkbM family methyltransferase
LSLLLRNDLAEMKNYVLKNPQVEELLRTHKLVIVDGGARGSLFRPFDKLNPDLITAIRFDPDPDADFEKSSTRDVIVNKALWNKSEKLSVNIAFAPTTSSVYPFNRELQKNIDPFYEKRNTQRTVEVDSISLDEYQKTSESPKIDFIKLDIHGAEYEALEGGKETMKSALGLLVESWIIPIHKGQKPRAAVELLAYDRGYYVVEENHRSMWLRTGPNNGKRQPVSLDTFFLKDPMIDHNVKDEVDALKLIGIADLFGHHAFALQLVDYFSEQAILSDSWKSSVRPLVLGNCALGVRERKKLEWFEKIKRRLDNCAF